MAAVVDHDVDVRVAAAQLRMEGAVGLVANHDIDRVFDDGLAARIVVHSNDAGARPEILPPHLQRPAVRDADFDNHRPASAKLREMAVVDLEIVPPFVYEATA